MVYGQSLIPPIGQWREHLPYKSAIDLAEGDGKIFSATPFSLFSVNLTDNSIERMSRMTGLSETGISAISYDAAGKKLVVAYQNSNIDIIYRNDIYNVPGVKQSIVTGNKNIYSIYPRANIYYLSTGLGVILVDAERYEVKDTWYIGAGGNHVKINGFTSDAQFYYAATEEGLKRVSILSPAPQNHMNWELLSGFNGLSPGAIKNVLNTGGNIIVEKNDSLFRLTGNSWSFIYTGNRTIINSNTDEGKILVSERTAAGIGRIIIINPDGTPVRVIENTGAVSFPRKAILVNNDPWVADQFASLSHINPGGSYQQYSLNSPQSIASGEMIVKNGTFYATAGTVNETWNYQYNGDGIYQFINSDWENINRYSYSVLDSLLDFIAIAVDPRDETIWAGSYGGGLLHVKPGPSFEIYKQLYLGPPAADPGSYRVSGLAFDRDNNLWVSNFGSTQPVRVLKNNGSWKNFTLPFTLFENAVSQIIIDAMNYKWIVSPLGNGLICFDHGADIDNISDDRWRRYAKGSGNGNLPHNDVLCIARDKNGYIWVGTSDGIAVIQCPEQSFSQPACDAVIPIVPNGNFAGFLFKGQQVRNMAVDGADRKWVATSNGVFLISPEGEKLIHHFTEDNSKLLSNDVKKIAIDGITGEVFFATQKGICSFRAEATEGSEAGNEVIVFPNPVPPGYTGTIGIRGLPADAIVKITELDGRLVYQAKALGGQATWDGRNYRGQKISSGVYLVLIENNKAKKNVGKIFFISP